MTWRGLEDVKEQIRLKLIYPFTHPEEGPALWHPHRGRHPALWSARYGQDDDCARDCRGGGRGLFCCEAFRDHEQMGVGEAEQNIELLFAEARKYPRAVIFVDEVESLVPKLA